MSAPTAAGAPDFPPELIRGVAWEAARDADRVHQFLAAVGLKGRPDRPLPLPRNFLLALGAGLRLLCWELQGLTAHRDAGLPAAREVIVDAFRSLTEPGILDPTFPAAVLGVWAERFYWNAPEEFGADVLIDALDADDGIAALAEFLWAGPGCDPNNACEN